MADPLILNNATIWLGGYDLSSASNEINFNASRAELEDSRYGDTVSAVYPGVLDVSVEVKGFFDSVLDGPLHSNLTTPAVWPLTICPDGGDDTEAAWGLQSYTFNYSTYEATWGQSLPYRLSGRSKSGGRLARGRVMLPKAAYSATADGTKYQLGAVSASQKLVAVLHVFSAVTGTWDFDVESDADAGAGGETSRGSFTQVAAASGPMQEVIEVSGPVTDEYWQVAMVETGPGSITAAITFSIVDA